MGLDWFGYVWLGEHNETYRPDLPLPNNIHIYTNICICMSRNSANCFLPGPCRLLFPRLRSSKHPAFGLGSFVDTQLQPDLSKLGSPSSVFTLFPVQALDISRRFAPIFLAVVFL